MKGTAVHDTDKIKATHTTALAAALYIAQYGYKLAITSPNPAARLDDMCDSVAEFWDDITPSLTKKFAGADLEFAETMRAAAADRLWAFAVVEHSRVEAGSGVGYLFDLLADNLRAGADPSTTRATALAAPKRIRDLAEPGTVRHANGLTFKVIPADSYEARLARDAHTVVMEDGTEWTTGSPIGWHGVAAAWRTDDTQQPSQADEFLRRARRNGGSQ